jgi:DNA-binding CsgD family transcriptional regulator
LRLDHGLLLRTPVDDRASALLTVHRVAKQGGFERREREFLQCVAPHLARATGITVQNMRLTAHCDSMSAVLDRDRDGVLVVDSQARVLYANHAALVALREISVLTLADGALGTRDPAAMGELAATIAACAHGDPGGSVLLHGHDSPDMHLEIVPADAGTRQSRRYPAAIVLIKQPAALPNAEQIQALLGVTPAQAALARELLNGDGIPAVAMRLGISRSTARTHLQELFQRTGTNRQAELVRVILQQKPIDRAMKTPTQRKRKNARI